MQEVAAFITGLFAGLDVRRRWTAVAGVLVLIIACVLLFETFTGYNYYRSLDKKVALLQKMHTMAKEGIANEPELMPIYESTLNEIASREIWPLRFGSTLTVDPVVFWKAFSGAFIGLVYLLLTLFGIYKPANRGSVVLGSVVIAFIFGLLGALLPTVYSPWVNYIGVPVLQVVILGLFGSRMGKRKAQARP